MRLPVDLNLLGVLVYSSTEAAGIKGLCAISIKLALLNRAHAVELVIGQHQYAQPRMTSPPYIRQRGRLLETIMGR